jgi:hypothetical protein
VNVNTENKERIIIIRRNVHIFCCTTKNLFAQCICFSHSTIVDGVMSDLDALALVCTTELHKIQKHKQTPVFHFQIYRRPRAGDYILYLHRPSVQEKQHWCKGIVLRRLRHNGHNYQVYFFNNSTYGVVNLQRAHYSTNRYKHGHWCRISE